MNIKEQFNRLFIKSEAKQEQEEKAQVDSPEYQTTTAYIGKDGLLYKSIEKMQLGELRYEHRRVLEKFFKLDDNVRIHLIDYGNRERVLDAISLIREGVGIGFMKDAMQIHEEELAILKKIKEFEKEIENKRWKK